jgi:glycosyltransferase involved in cell wall biosynthesis
MSSSKSGGQKLVLSMIVKNEAAVIERCLSAALPLCDAFVVIDTGSTDETIEKIRAVSSALGVKGLVAHDEWKNFGHNRTRAARLTKKYAKERGLPPDKTHMLLLDADMALVDMGFSKAELLGPGYLLEQRSLVLDGDRTGYFGSPEALRRLVKLPITLRWWNTRLCRLDHEWEAVGVTHEYWKAIPDAPMGRISTLWIADIGDGGAKGDKFERDILLLRQGIVEEPNNPRYYFYLAQTLFDLGRFDEAIPLYRKRIEIGGWEEECWYSLYRIGLALLRSGRESEGVGVMIEAYDRRPSRAETISALGRHLREKRTSAAGLLFAEKAVSTPVSQDTLFVHTDAYHSEPLEDVSILSYYHGTSERGLRACEELLSLRGLHEGRYELAAKNALFYRKPELPAVRRGTFEVPAELRTFNGVEYLASSASLVRTPDGVLANIRLVNYDHQSGRSFVGRDPDGRIRTENILYDFDTEAGTLSNPRLQSPVLPLIWSPDTRVLGLEDERWAYHDGTLYFTAVVYQVPGHLNHPQMAMGVSWRDGSAVVRGLTYADSKAIEKSWLPFSHQGELLLVYGYEPFKVLSVDTESFECKEKFGRTLDVRAAKWRGNTPPVTLPNGRMLMLVHELAYRDHDNVYLHRFIELDPDALVPIRYSEAFGFEHIGVEYALGLLALENGNVIASYGFEERESHWSEIDPGVIPWLPFNPARELT